MLRFSYGPALGASAVAVALAVSGAQEPNTTLSPFVGFLPSGNPETMTGLAIAFIRGPIALRADGHISMRESGAANRATAATMRPWGADADALAYLDGLTYGERVTFTPYVFTGVGTSAVDSGATRFTQHGWSFGSGLSLPLGSALGVFGEWRWRMSRLVLPTASNAPTPMSEARFGLSFRVGGSRSEGPVIHGDGNDALGSVASVIGKILSTADEVVGTRYYRGGDSPSSGFDAAGFVRYVFGQLGVVLPRTSRNQARVGDKVRADWHVIAPGDLVLFKDDEGIHHVAIYVGKNRIVHSSQTGGGVRYDDLNTERGRWFMDHLVAARRVTPDMRGLLLDLARAFAGEDNDPDEPDSAPRASSRRRR
ncbi:MAG TPA: C40 family peptidase [Gemmatimonadaceae bacterium]|nr:C40 family peptidase [Gemmatimonadaceae bacterium]